MSTLPRLMLVTDRQRTRGRDLVRLVAAAVDGGVGMVQLREPELTDDDLRGWVERIRKAVPAETLLVVNNRSRVALTMHTALHLPAAAPAIPAATRRKLSVTGRSAHDEAEAGRAIDENAGYLLLGTIYPTLSKPGHPGSGAALVERITRQVQPMPVFAIGGIRVSRVPEVIHAGAHGVAVCGEILSASDPRRAAEALTLALRVSTGC